MMNNNIYVFLPVESTNRELDYKANLARYFCNFGFCVLIGNPPFLRDELKYKNHKAIFIEKGVNPDPEYYDSLKKKGIYIYDLSDEGLGKCVYAITHKKLQDAMAKVRRIFLWGQGQKDELSEQCTNHYVKESMYVIGNPAFDLSCTKFREVYISLKPRKLPSSYILVSTNFAAYYGFSLEECIQACGNMAEETKRHYNSEYDLEKKQNEIFISWLKNIIQSFPNENFLIRPHPVEIKLNYDKLFSKYRNVVVSKEGNANQAIASAKLVLHKDSSTAIQSHLMGVPVISLGGKSLSKEYTQWPLAFSMQPETVDQAKELIQKLLDDRNWDEETQASIDKKAKKILESNFHNIGTASRALVDFIARDAEQLIRDKVPYKITDTRSKIQQLKHFIRKYLPLHYKIDCATRETLIKFTKKDILQRLALFESVEPLNIEFKVKKIFPNVYQISKK